MAGDPPPSVYVIDNYYDSSLRGMLNQLCDDIDRYDRYEATTAIDIKKMEYDELSLEISARVVPVDLFRKMIGYRSVVMCRKTPTNRDRSVNKRKRYLRQCAEI